MYYYNMSRTKESRPTRAGDLSLGRLLRGDTHCVKMMVDIKNKETKTKSL
jgi:hypothetical protein